MNLSALYESSTTGMLENVEAVSATGRIVASRGAMLVARLPYGNLGDLCFITTSKGEFPAQVVAFNDSNVTVAPLTDLHGIGIGATITCTGAPPQISVPKNPLGKIFDAIGNEIGGTRGGERSSMALDIYQAPVNPFKRAKVREQLVTGISALDTICPLGYGQRLGLLASAGIGKSTLLGMIARSAEVDVIVIGLIGERGREVRDFIEDNLGAEGLKRSVVVVATSDEPPVKRTLATYTATTLAEYFRDQGLSVLLLIDSLTRAVRAIRDVGLSAGEIPVRHGYPSSVYTELPKILERAGSGQYGTISAIYTLLTDNERELDPLAEEVKSILDGHIVLTKGQAEKGLRPAIDLTSSISRLRSVIVSEQDDQNAILLQKILARLNRDKDLVLLGGTADSELKACIEIEPLITEFISQRPHETRSITKSKNLLRGIIERYKDLCG